MTQTTTRTSTREYDISLCKGASAIEETRRLLQAWTPGEDEQAFLTRVRESGLLGRQTAHRTHDLVMRVFRPRLLRPNSEPARRLRLVQEQGNQRVFRELLFLYTARSNALLYDFTVEGFWPAARAGELYLGLDDVQEFLRTASDSGHIPRPWSATTRLKISRGVLGALRDFGFLYEHKRGQREIVAFAPADPTVAYLAYDLHLAGLTDAAVVEHPDWHLFGLSRENLLQRLDGLDERAGLVVQHAGSVVRISWLHGSIDEVINAYD